MISNSPCRNTGPNIPRNPFQVDLFWKGFAEISGIAPEKRNRRRNCSGRKELWKVSAFGSNAGKKRDRFGNRVTLGFLNYFKFIWKLFFI